MSGHAPLAPSAAHRWMKCAVSHALEQGLPDKSSPYAEEGTRAHKLAEWMLSGNIQLPLTVDRVLADMNLTFAGYSDKRDELQTMINHITGYVERVRNVSAAVGAEAMIETRVDCRPKIPDCYGTADVIIAADDELIVIDLKYGRGQEVDAEDNEQAQCYAYGALQLFQFTHEFKSVRVVIDQPRIGAPSEWVLSVEQLLEFADRAEAKAKKAILNREIWERSQENQVPELAVEDVFHDSDFSPGVKTCRWCKRYAICHVAQREVAKAIDDRVEDLTTLVMANPLVDSAPDRLSLAMSKVEFVEHWCKAVRAACFSQLAAGVPVTGWKLVQGKQGNREWVNEGEADKALEAARLKKDERYEYSLISPTKAEALLKKPKPKVWKKLQPLITRKDGSLSVAPESDKREAVSSKVETVDLTAEAAAQAEAESYA